MAEAERVILKLVTAAGADGGHYNIKGISERGPVNIEIPGEAASALIGNLIASLPALRKVSAAGTKAVFEASGFELARSGESGKVNLYIKCSRPAELKLGFAMTWGAIKEMGEKFSEAARINTQKIDRKPKHN